MKKVSLLVEARMVAIAASPVSESTSSTSGPSIETLEAILDVTYTWGYEEAREQLRGLYEKAKRGQWIPEEVLPWDTDVDMSKPMGAEQLLPLWGSEIWDRMTPAERVK